MTCVQLHDMHLFVIDKGLLFNDKKNLDTGNRDAT